MRKSIIKFIVSFFCAAIIICSADLAYAQKRSSDVVTNSSAPKLLQIDGKPGEWGDSIKYYNAASKLSYDIANDDTNIYLVIKAADKQTTSKILVGGIDFTVNISGKKKAGPTVTFPVLNRERMRNRVQQRGQQNSSRPDTQKVQQEILDQIKEIKVSGLKDIVDGSISMNNEYGIKAAVAYDKNENLVYELSVPLAQLGLDANSTAVFAYNIKINGIAVPRPQNNNYGNQGYNNGYGRGGMYGGMGGMRPPGGNLNRNTMFQPVDFWTKGVLAK